MDALTARERQRLDDDGYLAVEGVVDPERVTAMRTRPEELLAVTKQDHAGTLIVGGCSMRSCSTRRGYIRASVRRSGTFLGTTTG